MQKSKFGYMKCLTRSCLNGDGGPGRVVVLENERGTLGYRCDECGTQPYAHKGTGAHAAWLRDIERAPAAAPPKPEPAPKPAAADRKSTRLNSSHTEQSRMPSSA